MKRFLLLLCILCTLNVSAQITITSKYQPTDYSELTKALDDYWDRYDNFEKEIERVSNHIVNLLSQNIDKQMSEFLNAKHKETSNVAIELSQNGLTSAVKK